MIENHVHLIFILASIKGIRLLLAYKCPNNHDYAYLGKHGNYYCTLGGCGCQIVAISTYTTGEFFST